MGETNQSISYLEISIFLFHLNVSSVLSLYLMLSLLESFHLHVSRNNSNENRAVEFSVFRQMLFSNLKISLFIFPFGNDVETKSLKAPAIFSLNFLHF